MHDDSPISSLKESRYLISKLFSEIRDLFKPKCIKFICLSTVSDHSLSIPIGMCVSNEEDISHWMNIQNKKEKTISILLYESLKLRKVTNLSIVGYIIGIVAKNSPSSCGSSSDDITLSISDDPLCICSTMNFL